MANYDVRLAADYSFGQLSAGANALDTTLSSAAFAGLRSDLSPTMYLPITLADDSRGVYETVWATGHSAGSQNITVVRGREGSTVQTWPAGSTWRCAPTSRDAITSVASRGALPTDAHIGMHCYIVGESRLVQKGGTGWYPADPPFGHMGITSGFQVVNTGAYATMEAAQELVGGMAFNNASDALVVPIAGAYDLRIKAYATGGIAFAHTGEITINSSTVPAPSAAFAGCRASFWKQEASDYTGLGAVRRRLAANDVLRLWQVQTTNASTWGNDGYQGAWIEALWVAP